MSETRIFTAAFFRSRGKDVVTEKEFSMVVGMDLQWIPVKYTANLLKILESEGCITVKDGYVRPAVDIESISVPVTYRPSEDLRRLAASGRPPLQNEGASARKQTRNPAEDDVFGDMICKAASIGVGAREFTTECRKHSRRLGITMSAAGLLVLRDRGVDIAGLAERTEKELRKTE